MEGEERAVGFIKEEMGDSEGEVEEEALDLSKLPSEPLNLAMIKVTAKKADPPADISIASRIRAHSDYCCKQQGGKKGKMQT